MDFVRFDEAQVMPLISETQKFLDRIKWEIGEAPILPTYDSAPNDPPPEK